MPDIFISYSSKDISFAEELRDRLHAHGRNTVWRDKNDLINGSEWGKAIDDALTNSILVVLVISPDSMKSAYVTYEWCYAHYELKKELYFLHWKPSSHEGVFERLQGFHVPQCLHEQVDNAQWDKIINEVSQRLDRLPLLREARAKLITSGVSATDRENAARTLGGTQFHQTIACEYLLEGLRFQLGGEGYGSTQIEIARALNRVGDIRAVPAVWQLYEKAYGTPPNEYKPAKEIYEVFEQLSQRFFNKG